MSDVSKINLAVGNMFNAVGSFSSTVSNIVDAKKSSFSNYDNKQMTTEEFDFDNVNVSSTCDNTIIIDVESTGAEQSGGEGFNHVLGDFWKDMCGGWTKVKTWWNTDVTPMLGKWTNSLADVCSSCCATIGTIELSLLEGVGELTESLVDGITVLGTGVASVGTGVWDLATGSHVTVDMWDNVKSVISKEYVSSAFNFFYDNSSVGKWLKGNAYHFDAVRSVSNGIGYISGIVALTILTGGSSVAVMPAIAGVSGLGSGTEEAWKGGASVTDGLLYGLGNAGWEAFQFWIGGKISKLFTTKGAVGMLARVALDGIDGGIEGFVKPALSTIYKDGYYDASGNYVKFSKNDDIVKHYTELFDDNGGWEFVGQQVVIGSGMSVIGEVGNLKKFFKNDNETSVSVNKPVNDSSTIGVSPMEIQAKVDNYNKLLEVYNSKEYNIFLNDSAHGYATLLAKDGVSFDTLESRLIQAKDELDRYGINPNNNVSFGGVSKFRVKEGIVEFDNLYDISLEELDNINNGRNYLYVSKNGEKLNFEQLKRILTNTSHLKKDLVSMALDVCDPILRAKLLYNELNRKLYFAPEWITGDEAIKQQIFSHVTTFENLNPNNRVVCKGWSELMEDLLISSGFKESDVKILGGAHRWVEIDLGDGTILSLDPTDVLNKSIDLANCKAGVSSNGFVRLNKKNSGFRLSNLYQNQECYSDFLRENKKFVRKIDEALGYVGENGYLEDEIQVASDLFSNPSNKMFSDEMVKHNIENIFGAELPKDMDGYEAFTFYDMYRRKTLSSELLGLHTFFFRKSDGAIDSLNFAFTELDIKGPKAIVYSSSFGKKQFDSVENANQFLKTLDIIER